MIFLFRLFDIQRKPVASIWDFGLPPLIGRSSITGKDGFSDDMARLHKICSEMDVNQSYNTVSKIANIDSKIKKKK